MVARARTGIRDFFGADPADFHTAVHAGRQYITTDGTTALYATDRTFYLITAYCCVDFGPFAGATPEW